MNGVRLIDQTFEIIKFNFVELYKMISYWKILVLIFDNIRHYFFRVYQLLGFEVNDVLVGISIPRSQLFIHLGKRIEIFYVIHWVSDITHV
jgi:hypothetical protein